MSTIFLWTPERLEQLERTKNLPVRRAAKIIGCTLGTLAGKRKRLSDTFDITVDPDDWEDRLRETWEERKARRRDECLRKF